MDEAAADRALELDEDLARTSRTAWLALVDIAVWGDLKASAPAGPPRLRKRALDTGERLRSMFASRGWIPRRRERLKNALASLLGLQQSLGDLERAVAGFEGGKDLAALRRRCTELHDVAAKLQPAAGRWAALLESQYRDERE